MTGEDTPVLRAVAAKVVNFDGKLKKFVRDLKDTMIAAKGLGIAAPQVGESSRVFWVTLSYGKKNQMMVSMVNPEILGHGEEVVLDEEGCLSLPGRYGKVNRYKEIEVKYQDLSGKEHVLRLEGLDARVVQHEYDHLEGVLFIDLLGKEKEVDLLM